MQGRFTIELQFEAMGELEAATQVLADIEEAARVALAKTEGRLIPRTPFFHATLAVER